MPRIMYNSQLLVIGEHIHSGLAFKQYPSLWYCHFFMYRAQNFSLEESKVLVLIISVIFKFILVITFFLVLLGA